VCEANRGDGGDDGVRSSSVGFRGRADCCQRGWPNKIELKVIRSNALAFVVAYSLFFTK
jgi:hypothetical protein